jgi:SAM-dependent methyltransferase
VSTNLLDDVMTESYQIIDGIKCYAPDVAFDHSGFRPEYYERLYRLEEKNFWFRSRNRLLCGLLEKYVGTSRTADYLEIGCGTGYVLKGFSKFTRLTMTGADVLVEGLTYAKKRLPDVEFIQFDAAEMPFSEEFDAVGAYDVLEHIQDDLTVMKNVARALRPHGLFFVTVPQHRFLWSVMDEIGCHKRRYSRGEFVEKLTASGFAIEFLSSFVFTLFPLMLASRFLTRSKGKTQRGNDAGATELQPPGIVNSVLESLMRIDELLIRRNMRLPFGGSLVGVARKL